MDKQKLIFGVIGAVLVVGGLIGFKYYKDSQATSPDATQQQTNGQQPDTFKNDPYANYAAPSSNNQ